MNTIGSIEEGKMASVKGRFFIIGTQRSGTTLLRLILNSHSQIAIPRESAFLMPLLKKKFINRCFSGKTIKAFDDNISLLPVFKNTYVDGNYSDFFSQLSQRERVTLRELIDDMFSSHCRNEGKSIWGNKTPSFFRKIDILFTLFPDAKFIHIVRDGRDVFDSWRKMNPSMNNVAFVALDWRYKLLRIEKSFKKIPANNRITIRYEDLLNTPENIIESICSLLGVNREANMLDFYKSSHKYTIPHHSELIFKPLDKSNVYKWKNNLISREVKIFNLLARHYLKKYNYEIENSTLTLLDILFMIKSLLVGLPQRLIRIIRMKRIMEKALDEE
jgi:hypothetical protein